MIQFFINDYTDELKQNITDILPDNFKADPNDIFDLTIKVCNRANTIVDASAIQILITLLHYRLIPCHYHLWHIIFHHMSYLVPCMRNFC